MPLQSKVSFRLIAFIAVILVPFCMLLAVPQQSAAAEVSIKGDVELKIRGEAPLYTVKGGTLDGATIQRDGERWVLTQKDKTVAGTAEWKDEGLLLKDGGGEAKILLIRNANQFYFRNPADKTLLNRVKIKEDKFNIYNAEAKRLLHGKQKSDGFGVKNQKGTQVLKIKGTDSLRETCFLAVPVAIQFRLLAWAARAEFE